VFALDLLSDHFLQLAALGFELAVQAAADPGLGVLKCDFWRLLAESEVEIGQTVVLVCQIGFQCGFDCCEAIFDVVDCLLEFTHVVHCFFQNFQLFFWYVVLVNLHDDVIHGFNFINGHLLAKQVLHSFQRFVKLEHLVECLHMHVVDLLELLLASILLARHLFDFSHDLICWLSFVSQFLSCLALAVNLKVFVQIGRLFAHLHNFWRRQDVESVLQGLLSELLRQDAILDRWNLAVYFFSKSFACFKQVLVLILQLCNFSERCLLLVMDFQLKRIAGGFEFRDLCFALLNLFLQRVNSVLVLKGFREKVKAAGEFITSTLLAFDVLTLHF
jgi:hypothetical protein